jgi:hypothetical protein
MTTTERFFLLPPRIDYAGFTFHLQFTEHRQYGIGLAYVLTGCHSNKRYKRQAWKDGYWEDRAAPRQISTMFSNYLFYEPLFDRSDACLQQALSALHERMQQAAMLPPDAYRRDMENENLICSPLKLIE